ETGYESSPSRSTGSELIEHIGSQIKAMLDSYRPVAQVHEEMQQSLLDKIANGLLAAYGYPVENGVVGGEPSAIPPAILKLRFAYWHKSSFKGLGHEFESVRVVRPPRARSGAVPARGELIPAPPPRKPPGPHSGRAI